MGQGRDNEAKAILIKYHGDGDPASIIVNLEMQEMAEVIELDGSDKRWWDFRELFNTREARYRTFLVTCVAWFAELDLPPTSYYFPLMGMLYPLKENPPYRLCWLTLLCNSQNSWYQRRLNPATPQCLADTDHDGCSSLWPSVHSQVRSTTTSHVLQFRDVDLRGYHHSLHSQPSRQTCSRWHRNCVPLRISRSLRFCLGKNTPLIPHFLFLNDRSLTYMTNSRHQCNPSTPPKSSPTTPAPKASPTST